VCLHEDGVAVALEGRVDGGADRGGHGVGGVPGGAGRGHGQERQDGEPRKMHGAVV
jgi:hypothetical protein